LLIKQNQETKITTQKTETEIILVSGITELLI